MVGVLCCLCLLTHMAVAHELLNYPLHPRLVIITSSYFKHLLYARVTHCWLVVNFFDDFKLQLVLVDNL